VLSWHVSSSGLEKEHVGEGPVLLSSLPFVCDGKKKKKDLSRMGGYGKDGLVNLVLQLCLI